MLRKSGESSKSARQSVSDSAGLPGDRFCAVRRATRVNAVSRSSTPQLDSVNSRAKAHPTGTATPPTQGESHRRVRAARRAPCVALPGLARRA